MAELGSNEGADCSLLVSPRKVKLGWLDEEVVLEVALALLPLLLVAEEAPARRSIQGTATCFPEADEEELPRPDPPTAPD
jgi:hypothetical protein